jgi:DDE superfamily endonuclease
VLPEKWTADRDRCRAAAGIGDDDAGFATKPKLARKMIERAVKAGVPFSWAVGDEVWGGNPQLRAWLPVVMIIPGAQASAVTPNPHDGVPVTDLYRERAAVVLAVGRVADPVPWVRPIRAALHVDQSHAQRLRLEHALAAEA